MRTMTKLVYAGVSTFNVASTRAPGCWAIALRLWLVMGLVNPLSLFAEQVAVPMDLDQAIEIALRNNPTLVQPRSQLTSSNNTREFALEEFTLQFAPVASVSATESRTEGSIGLTAKKLLPNGTRLALDVLERQEVESGDRNGTIKVEVVQPLLRRYGKMVTQDGLHAAENARVIAQMRLHLARIDTANSTIKHYLEIHRQKLLIEESTRDVKRSQELLRIVAAKEQIGRAVQADRLQIELKLSQATLKLETQRADLDVLTDNFEDLLNLDESFRYEMAGVSEVIPETTPSLALSLERALSDRLEHRLLQLEIERARRIHQISERGNLPDLELTAHYEQSVYGDSFEDNTDPGRYFIGISTKSDFGRLREKRQIEQTRSQLTRKVNELSLYRRGLKREVSRAISDLTRAANELRQADNILMFAKQQLVANQKLFAAGRTDSFRVADAQAAFTQSQSNRILAESGLVGAYYNYRRATGQLMPVPDHRTLPER